MPQLSSVIGELSQYISRKWMAAGTYSPLKSEGCFFLEPNGSYSVFPGMRWLLQSFSRKQVTAAEYFMKQIWMLQRISRNKMAAVKYFQETGGCCGVFLGSRYGCCRVFPGLRCLLKSIPRKQIWLL